MKTLSSYSVCTAVLLSIVIPAGLSANHYENQSDQLGPPPALKAQPTAPEWPKGSKNEIDTALTNYLNDQVSAFLTFREALDDKDSKLSTEQRAWLEDCTTLLKTRVPALLRRDMEVAASRRDLRGAYIAWFTLAENGFESDSILKGLPTIAELMKQTIRSERSPDPVWDIKEIVGQFLPSFEENVFMTTSVTIKPEAGQRILRVRAHVKNVSAASDPMYVRWSLGNLRRAFLGMQGTSGGSESKPSKPNRLAGDRFIQVVSGDGQAFPCSYVSVQNRILGSEFVRLIVGGSPDPAKVEGILRRGQPGSFVERGVPFDIDVMFSVPQDIDNFKLLIFGSLPVPIQMNKN